MDELIAEFIREAEAVGARVHLASQAAAAGTLSSLVLEARSVVLSASLERYIGGLRELGIDAALEGTDAAAAEGLPHADAGICEAIAGVAASGTVLVGPGAGFEGVISILPPHSIILLKRDRIHEDVAAALEATADLVAAPGSRLAFITGPSRTSDIELTPVIGVHGPLRLDLVVIDD